MKKRYLIAFSALCLSATSYSMASDDAYHCEQTRNGLRCYGGNEASAYIYEASAWRFGIEGSLHSWSYDDGPSNLFVGPGVLLEYSSSWWAAQTAFQYHFLVNSDEAYTLTSAQGQVMVGPSLSSTGISPFLLAGSFINGLNTPLGNSEYFMGWLAGAGIQFDFGKNAIALQTAWHSNQGLAELWRDAGFPAESIIPLHSKLSLKSRF